MYRRNRGEQVHFGRMAAMLQRTIATPNSVARLGHPPKWKQPAQIKAGCFAG